tara:strand:+ start:89 stop:385 length:297 start_codon:yes stop_codon:yes gene_type:complete
MIIQGSMRYSPSGRKRKTNAYKKKARPKFVAQQKKNFKKPDTTPEIPSLIHSSKTKCKNETLSAEERLEISKNYTVAPAYNKGAYQVIPKGDVKWIGK